MKISILGVPFERCTRTEALDYALRCLQGQGNHLVFTPNPEMVMRARKDPAFMHILQQGDMVLPDGTGIVLASRLHKESLPQRVTGCDLTQAILAAAPRSISVYIFGAAPGVAEKAKANIEATYPNVTVVGHHHGYFSEKEEKLILKEIQQKEPDLLLIGLSMGKQEAWAHAHKHLPVKLTMCVGGTIDVLADVVPRAPKAFRAVGLEWLFRLLRQPARIVRMGALPAFAWLAVREALTTSR